MIQTQSIRLNLEWRKNWWDSKRNWPFRTGAS